MAVQVVGGSNIAVPQPCLDILRVAAALAQGVHRAVPQVVEADGLEVMGLQHPPEVVRHKIRVDGGAVRLHADIPAVGVVPAKKPLVFLLALPDYPQVVPHGGRQGQYPVAGSGLGFVRV